MIGQTISHYNILEKLGQGGMGEVFKVEDLKLKRFVALKFLPPHLTSDQEANERFMYEAQTASALDHQNICTIHEFDESDDGRMFICMAYYDGATLKQKISEELTPIEEAIDIAIQIARGLDQAHAQDIIHRDLKPSNTIVQKDGTVKIIDFGLSKLLGTHITKTGTTMGTVAYMSPEQARGKSVGRQSDIWSLGVVLYEMLSGQLPFRGEVEQTIIYAILNEEPVPVSQLRGDVPIELEWIVNKALAKNPQERYSDSKEMLADLKALSNDKKSAIIPRYGTRSEQAKRYLSKNTTVAVVLLFLALALAVFIKYLVLDKDDVTSERKMLAVLPFENFGEAEDQYFVDGMTDEITARLAALQGLGVIARSSAKQYKDTEKSIPEIGKELGVEFVMEGSVLWHRTSEGQSLLRITPRLIKVSDATHLWAKVYEKDIADIFQLQSDIAKEVVSSLELTLLKHEQRALQTKPTDNLEAYDFYLRGNDYFFRSNSYEDTRIAIQMYEKAIELDLTFAHAYARLSYSHLKFIHWGWDKSKERLARAKQALDKALELVPNLAEAQLALGYYYYWGLSDLDKAIEQFSFAREQQSNNSELMAAIGFVQRRQGKWGQSIKNMNKAFELDPRSSGMAINLGHIYHFLRNYTEAERYYDRAISLAPDVEKWYLFKALLYLSWGSLERLQNVLVQGSRQANPLRLQRKLAYGFGDLARMCNSEFQQTLARLSLRPIRTDTLSHYFLTKAMLYGQMDLPDYERAYYDSARIIYETLAIDKPEDAHYRMNLAHAYAGLGRKEEAIREGNKSVQLLPVSRDAVRGSHLAAKLAEIYLLVGEHDAAIEQLKYALSIPGFISSARLRIDPLWEPLRQNPRFRKLSRD